MYKHSGIAVKQNTIEVSEFIDYGSFQQVNPRFSSLHFG